MITIMALFTATCIVCVINIVRYFSALRALLAVMRTCDPHLYQQVDGAGFFTPRGRPAMQLQLARYLYERRYRGHQEYEFIFRCEQVRRQFILTSALCAAVVIALAGLLILH
ncbi:universal stress protein UspB [Tatumella terrea]|uniref:Universal stress protein B n=1 Tax=Tatumella terrea TaxID=419007 RepID=A0ABW1VSY9_9GAMM